MKTNAKDKLYYWVAINGAAVPATLIGRMPRPTVTPTPEVLLGFPSRREAAETQRFLLTAPVADCRAKLAVLKSRTDIAYFSFPNPGKVQRGMPTMWGWG